MKNIVWLAASTLILSNCTTSQQAFQANPSAVTTSALCRTLVETQDIQFRQELYSEITKRSVSVAKCEEMVRSQNQAIAAGVAIALVGTAVAVCANNDCSGGGYRNPYQGADWDEFYNQYGTLVWACRSIATGQFTYDSDCYGKSKIDWRWPSKLAY